MAKFKKSDETLYFLNNLPIEISYKNTQIYSKCKTYDSKKMNNGSVWHQVVVIHKGKVQGVAGKRSILEAIFEVVEGIEFYPVAYRHGAHEDKFLVRQCCAALDKLFAQNLRIQLSNGAFVPLHIQFNVADFKFGQISPFIKIEQALRNRFDRLERVNGREGILNLCQFQSNSELLEVVVNLANRGVLQRVCEFIYRNDEMFRKINGLIMSKNGITTLAPLKAFNGGLFGYLDLRDNELKSPIRLCRDLKNIKSEELLLAGNPVTKLPTYPKCLKSVLKNFKRIDDIPVENLSKDYTPMDDDIDVDCDGFRIDCMNYADLYHFENSTDWHAVMIPDPEQEFTKEEIMDYFFTTVSSELSDIYPSYYKYADGEHQFLVRNCYDQLKYLVEVCNMEIKIPSLVHQEFQNSVIEMLPQLRIEKTLNYYFRMNITPYKKGQVDPLECIDNAIIRRFSAMDRLLNLDNFHEIEGLENIVINLSSPRILGRVLIQAARKFVSSCVELRLRNNKIINANFPKVLALMLNLKVIDLSNNWLHDINDIKELDKLHIKSLKLDGNPLCSQYGSAGEYIRAIKQHFPGLQRLDNIELASRSYLGTQKNFLCNIEGYDFVEQFVTHYFKMFSSSERGKIRDFYHPNALFTMTCNFAAASTYGIKRISKYESSARNLYRMSDFSRAFTSVHAGQDAICQVFLRLPNIDFDMMNFSSDTPVFNDKIVVIIVHGVFMDRPSFVDVDILMAFTRTFVLTPVEKNLGVLKCATSYKILNEQFNIFNPTSTQLKTSFKFAKNEDNRKSDKINVADKEGLLIMFQEITSLKSIWCTRCFEDAKWEFPAALEVFLSLSQRNEIPETAFI